MIIVTATSSGHLPRAMVMAKSAKTHMPDCKVIVGLMERHIPSEAFSYPYFDEIVLFQDLHFFPNFNKFIFQYSVVEAGGAGKAQILKYAFEKYTEEEQFVYLDTDMKVLGPFAEIFDLFRHYSIILTPHLIHSPDPFDPGYLKTVKYYGINNAGFIGVKRDNSSAGFIDWWIRRIEHDGYLNDEHFGDQTWIDLVPSYFDRVHILRHPGYNFAFWNYHQRTLSLDEEQHFLAEGLPLRCVHFSCYNTLYMSSMHYLPERQQQLLMQLRDEYEAELNEEDKAMLHGLEWSYNCFYDGATIERESKKVYRTRYFNDPAIDDPFALSNDFFKTSDELDEEPHEEALADGQQASRTAGAKRRAARKTRRVRAKKAKKLRSAAKSVKTAKRRKTLKKSKRTVPRKKLQANRKTRRRTAGRVSLNARGMWESKVSGG